MASTGYVRGLIVSVSDIFRKGRLQRALRVTKKKRKKKFGGNYLGHPLNLPRENIHSEVQSELLHGHETAGVTLSSWHRSYAAILLARS